MTEELRTRRELLGGNIKSGLPADGCSGTLIGRVWDPRVNGPSPVIVLEGDVFDISHSFATVRDLCETETPAEAARLAATGSKGAAAAKRLGSLEEIEAATALGEVSKPRLLAPVDLQTIKAAGVTFVASMVERVIEERVRGHRLSADGARSQVLQEIGDLGNVLPGSAAALQLRRILESQGAWSQYLEVGIGPDAEIFTKAPSLSAVGALTRIGVPVSSQWNNSEPEVVLAVSSSGRVVGAMLGNDVNLRDVEGRSALLLPQAKDNRGSCALGPFLRLFDASFSLEGVRSITVELTVVDDLGFYLHDESPMSEISRDPAALVEQLFRSHDYPDGAVLMLGTLFAPLLDRESEGSGFTHKPGDVVRIAAPELGSLVNEVQYCEDCEPWTFGVHALMSNLADRGLLSHSSNISTE